MSKAAQWNSNTALFFLFDLLIWLVDWFVYTQTISLYFKCWWLRFNKYLIWCDGDARTLLFFLSLYFLSVDFHCRFSYFLSLLSLSFPLLSHPLNPLLLITASSQPFPLPPSLSVSFDSTQTHHVSYSIQWSRESHHDYAQLWSIDKRAHGLFDKCFLSVNSHFTATTVADHRHRRHKHTPCCSVAFCAKVSGGLEKRNRN